MLMNKIAIILPVYKKDKDVYLAGAVGSILKQTYNDWHLYIGVDGPVGDKLKKKLEEYEVLSNVSIILFEENRGLACVLNDLLDICFRDGYEFIARMDADDMSLPDRLEKQIAFLKVHPKVDVVGGAIDEINEKGISRYSRCMPSILC